MVKIATKTMGIDSQDSNKTDSFHYKPVSILYIRRYSCCRCAACSVTVVIYTIECDFRASFAWFSRGLASTYSFLLIERPKQKCFSPYVYVIVYLIMFAIGESWLDYFLHEPKSVTKKREPWSCCFSSFPLLFLVFKNLKNIMRDVTRKEDIANSAYVCNLKA